MLTTGGGGGTFYWFRNDQDIKIQGIVVLFGWGSVHLKSYIDIYSSCGWNSLVVLAHFFNPVFPERATSLAFSVLNELLEELRARPCPVVLASFSGGSQACMYKVLQIIEGTCEAHLNLDDSRLIMTCISGQMYDSGPVSVTSDLGARFALNSSVLNVPGSSKLVSMVAKGVTSGLDAMFLTRFGSHRSEYWQTLYSSVGLGAPFLILCSENDELAPYPVICSFAQQVQGLGGHVRLIGWKDSPHVGHYKHNPTQYRTAVTEFLDHTMSIFNQKLQKVGERTGMEGMHDKICELICDLQKAAVDSNQSLRRVATGPNDHFFLPSSAECQTTKESGSLHDEENERKSTVHLGSPPGLGPHSVLGQVLFDVCVPKNIEGWDIKFENRKPFETASKRSSPLKRMRRSRL
ncbi:putative alpha/Beta hydrolase [Helianthus annuus]|nr:putative alpha/Beta hydrolase [Helianthus annuus]